MAISKIELYKSTLKREQAFVVFLATGETDITLLPEPLTKAEEMLFELCKEQAGENEPASVEEPKVEAKKTTKRSAKK